MINTRAEVCCLVRDDALLGEGPVWDPRENALYWVNIKGTAISRWTQSSGQVDRWKPPYQVASLAPAAAGGFIAATNRGFAHIDPAANRYVELSNPEADRPGNRFNDGKLDRRGRFWAGTMDDAELVASGALYRLNPDGKATRIDDGYRVTNGPAFDREGHRLYHTDSARQMIYAFDLEDDGEVSGKRTFTRFGPDEGYPDGMTVDAENCLWVAFWDGGCIRRLSPTGEKLGEIALPVPRVTSCAFGGSDMATLFVTTASIGLDTKIYPLAGSLFSLRPGVAGIPDVFFGNGDLT